MASSFLRLHHLLLLSSTAFALLPLKYVEPVFRPPAEAGSLILQVTTGCSWNKCSFCEMYQQPQQTYKVKPLSDVESDLRLAAAMREAQGAPVRRIFLADGDAMGLPSKQLAAILGLIREALPECKRVSSYCLPRNVRGKSVEELASLKRLGLRTMYVGCESGDDEVLRRVGKGETLESSVEALRKLTAAGLKTSVMILHGLGGRQLSAQHVAGSAELVRRAPPTYLSTLVVSFPLPGSLARHAEGFADLPPSSASSSSSALSTATAFTAAEARSIAGGEEGNGAYRRQQQQGGFEELSTSEVVAEQRALIEALGTALAPSEGEEESKNGAEQQHAQQQHAQQRSVIFRSDHASNYLPLKGTLPRDHGRLMQQLEAAEQGRVRLRPEWARGL